MRNLLLLQSQPSLVKKLSRSGPARIDGSICHIRTESMGALLDRITPDVAFSELTKRTNIILEMAIEFDGIILHSADEFLVIFAEDLVQSKKTKKNHAVSAMLFALEVQKRNLAVDLENNKKPKCACPLKIGVASGHVWVGEVEGTAHSVAVGSDLDMARDLSSRCEIHRILCSYPTHNLAKIESGYEKLYQKRHLNGSNDHSAYEYNPFIGRPEDLLEAGRIWSATLNLERKQKRYQVKPTVTVYASEAKGTLLNFSEGGLAIAFDTFYAQKTIIVFTMDCDDKHLKLDCEQHGIPWIKGIVRWGTVEKKRFIHGLEFIEMSAEQKATLNSLLSRYVAT